VELRFEDDPLAQSFVARVPELRATHQALGLTDALPPASNIVHFQRRFVLRDEGREANDDLRRFVFHTYERNLDKLTPRKTLERALVERMRAGGTWRAPTGVTSLR
jgi:hypothetical protein